MYLSVYAQDDDFASSPLGMACRKNQLKVVKILIDNGAMVNYQNKICFDFHSSCGYMLLLYLCILNRLAIQVFSLQLIWAMKKLYSICFTLVLTLKCITR